MGLPSLAGVEALVHIRPDFRGLPIASFHCRVGFAPALCLTAALLDGTAKCPESLRPMSVLPHWGDVYTVSCEDITPRSSLLRTHSPIPSGSSFLRPQPRARSLRRLLPAPAATGIFPTLSLRIFPRMLGPLPRRSHGVRIPVSSSVSSAFPQRGLGRLPAGGVFEAADISLCSGLRVCSSPRSFLPLLNVPQGSRDFYIRAERASLPLHAPDMLAVRIQAIDGTRTFTLLDSQPCRPLPPRAPPS